MEKNIGNIFISYSHRDKSIVDSIAQELAFEFGSENIFYDSWSIQPGNSIIGKMNEGLELFNTFFFFLSSKSLDSNMAALEWRSALNKSVNTGSKFVVVRLEDCSIPTILSDLQYIDLYKDGIVAAIKEMKAVVKRETTYETLCFFQNLIAVMRRLNSDVIQIEVKAECFVEENPEIAFVCEGGLDFSSICFDVEYGSYTFYKWISINNEGKDLNGKGVGLHRAIKPGFPYIFQLIFDKTDRYNDVMILQLKDKANGIYEQIPLYDETGVIINNIFKHNE